MRRQCRRTMTRRTLYEYVGSLTRPVRYRSETGLHPFWREAPSAPLKGELSARMG